MKIKRAELEEREIEILRELSQTDCNAISCEICPLNFVLGNGLKVCSVDAAVLVLKQNSINPMKD